MQTQLMVSQEEGNYMSFGDIVALAALGLTILGGLSASVGMVIKVALSIQGQLTKLEMSQKALHTRMDVQEQNQEKVSRILDGFDKRLDSMGQYLTSHGYKQVADGVWLKNECDNGEEHY